MKKVAITGTLAKSDEDKVRQWFKDKDCHCPSCKSGKWEEANIVGLVLGYGVQTTRKVEYPTIIMTCKNCGLISLFCASTLGLLPES